jgi:hypothetical protein
MSRRMYEYLGSNSPKNEAKDSNPLKFAIIATVVIVSVIFFLITYLT